MMGAAGRVHGPSWPRPRAQLARRTVRLARNVALVVFVAYLASLLVVSASTESLAPTMRVHAPAAIAVGSTVTIDVFADDPGPLGAYEIGASVAGPAVLEGADVGRDTEEVADRSISDLGDRAVLAASCLASCVDGEKRERLGRLHLRATEPGVLVLRIGPALAIRPDGSAIPLAGSEQLLRIVAGDGPLVDRLATPPPALEVAVPGRPGALVDLTRDGVVDRADVSEVAVEWQLGRLEGGCARSAADLDGNGCVDLGDLLAAQRTLPTTVPIAAVTGSTWVVNSTGDTSDANTGDGVCRTTVLTCTLRAAIQQSNAQAGTNRIEFNIAGSGVKLIQLGSRLPTISDASGALTIDGYTQPGAAPNTDPVVSNADIRIAIRGNGAPGGFDGFAITSRDNTIRGLSIYNMRRDVWINQSTAIGNKVIGSFIGTDPTGTFASPAWQNFSMGINAEQNASDTIIGGSAPADRNVISGTAAQGVGLFHNGTDRTVIRGNIVGLSPDGLRELPNRRHGVDMNFGVSETIVGGTGPGQRNVISGNDNAGVEVSHTTLTAENQIIGNFIGTDLTGESAPLYARNKEHGVYVEDAARDTIVSDNVIGNNARTGVTVINGGTNGVTAGTIVQNNWIGVSPGGVAMGNGQMGVRVEGSTTHVIGNTIANNVGAGISSSELDAADNRFSNNVIYGNSSLPIDLAPLNVVNPNDADDADTGPNGLLNHPAVTRVTSQVLEGRACAGCSVEAYRSDAVASARQLLFTGTAHAATGDFSIPTAGLAIGTRVVTLAITPAGATSELSPIATSTDHTDPPVFDPVGPFAGPEGSSIPLVATADDPDGDPFTIAWDLDDNGSFETPGASVSFSAANIDGPATRTVRARATDSKGASSTVESIVAINNVAPTGTLVVEPDVLAEGGIVTASIADPTDAADADESAGIRYAFSCSGGSLDHVTYAAAGTASATSCPMPDGPSNPIVRAVLLDDDGGRRTLAATVDVANVDPSVTFTSAPQSADEGDSVTFSAEATDPSPTDTVALDWSSTATSATGSGPSFSFTPADDGTATVTVSASDDDGGTDVASAPLVVRNVAPSGTFTTSSNVAFGVVTSVLRIEDPFDPSAADVAAGLRYAFSCNGASLAGTTWASASTNPERTCLYVDGSTSHFVRAAVVDKDGGLSLYSTTASAGSNQPPEVSAPSSFTVAEGGTTTVTATGTDPEGGAVTYAWDLDGNGTFETPGQEPVFSAAALDGPMDRSIEVAVTDSQGATSTSQSLVHVTNESPAATFADRTVNEGVTASMALSAVSDPSSADAATLRYAFSCTGASLAGTTYASASSSPSVSCPTSDGPAAQTVTAVVLDNDGGSTHLSATLTIENLAPAVSLSAPPAGLDEGDLVSLSGSASDVPADEAAGLGVAWRVLRGATVVASGGGATPSFTATDDGTYTVELTATDKDGGTGGASRSVVVASVAPTGTLVVPSTTTEGATLPVDVTGVSDPSSADVEAGIRYAVSCTGGSLAGTTYATASATVQDCTYPDETSTTVRVRLIDDDGAFTERTAAVTVTNVAPTAKLLLPAQIIAGEPLTPVMQEPADPSPTDTAAGFSYAFNCGSGYGAWSSSASASCGTPSGPSRTISAKVRDADLAETAYAALAVIHPNGIGNNGFEVDANGDGRPDGWTWSSAAIRETASARTGSWGVRQATAASTTTKLQRDMPVVERQPYLASTWLDVSGTSGTSSVTVRVRWLSSTGSQLSTATTTPVTTTTSGWTRISMSRVAPAGATTARFEIETTTAGGRTVRLDDTAMAFDNTLLNSDLELDTNADGKPDEWFQTSRFLVAGSPVYNGAASGAVQGNGTTFSPGQRIFFLRAGTTYYASTWVNVPSPTDNPVVILRIRWLNSAHGTIGQPVVLQTVSNQTPGWVQLAGSAVAPAGVADTLLEVTFQSLDTVAYVDGAYVGPS